MQLSDTKRNIPVLAISQAFASCGPPMVVLLGGILGTKLAPTAALATLPVSMMIVGVALMTVPAALLMNKIGRKFGFQVGACLGALGALLGAFAINQENFALFCTTTLLVGASNAFVQQYRFAASESVPDNQSSQAVSWVLVGGIFAGFVGPQIGTQFADWLPGNLYTGSFIALACIYFLVVVWLVLYRNVQPKTVQINERTARPLTTIVKQPLFIISVLGGTVAYGVMSFIMTATPIHMHTQSGFSIQATRLVIQSHLVAMYLPSLFSGWLIKQFGVSRVMYTGLLAFFGCVIIAVIRQDLLGYWSALVLLGIGWNFLFVGSTVLLTYTYFPTERFKSQALNDFTIFGVQAVTSLSAGTVLFMANWDILNLINLPVLVVTGILLALSSKYIMENQTS